MLSNIFRRYFWLSNIWSQIAWKNPNYYSQVIVMWSPSQLIFWNTGTVIPEKVGAQPQLLLSQFHQMAATPGHLCRGFCIIYFSIIRRLSYNLIIIIPIITLYNIILVACISYRLAAQWLLHVYWSKLYLSLIVWLCDAVIDQCVWF